MSAIAALIGTRGSTVTIERPTSWTRNANGSQVPSGYTEAATGVKVLFGELTETVAQMVFGGNPMVTSRGWYAGTAIQKKDRLVVTAGFRTAEKLVVEEIVPQDFGSANRHYDLGLNSTAETIA